MPFSQTILIQPDGWGWKADSQLQPPLRLLASSLHQARANVLRVVEHIPDEILWRPAGQNIPTIGALLRHLAGTEHQWIGNKVGLFPLQRDRGAEFSGPQRPALQDLLAAWEQVRQQTNAVIANLTAQSTGPTPAQAFCFEYTAQHFSYHCGQMVTLRKLFDPNYSVYPPIA